MSTMINNGFSVVMGNQEVIINGIKYKKPGHGDTVVQADNCIYINGYEFKNGKFKKTLKAIIKCMF